MGLAFASCSSDDLADNGTIAAVDEVRFLKVALCNPGSGPANRALSGDDKYETGTDAENTCLLYTSDAADDIMAV